MEIMKVGLGFPASAHEQAQRAEKAGYDGLLFVENQKVFGDPYVAMTMAMQATTKLRVGTAVTNPVTRHVAVTAAAISTVHVASGGRAILGIGRGDSALANLGMAPVKVAAFEEKLKQLQWLLAGEQVPFEDPSIGSLNLGKEPPGTQLGWLPSSLPKVPLDVFASGQRVIAAAVRNAERVTFAVGAQRERLEWSIATAREAGANGDCALGALIVCAPHPDIAVARRLLAGGVATAARLAGMQQIPSGPINPEDVEVYERIRTSYDMTRHGQPETPQAAAVTDEFIDRYAVLGPVDVCVARLRSLFEMGLNHLVLVHSVFAEGKEAKLSVELLEGEVVPALKESIEGAN
jgi:5,10-methylenetetrahydromethanopterin reductase